MPDARQQGAGFGQEFEWDIPLLEGYNWRQAGEEYLRGSGALDKFIGLRIAGAKKLIQSFQPDAVIMTGWQCLGLVQLLFTCKRLRIPVLIRAESNGLNPVAGIKNRLHRILVSQFHACLAIGKANRKFYQDHGISPDKIFDCPYFVDNQYFSDQARQHAINRQASRAEWNIPEQAFCYCYVGKLIAKKRIMDVLSALKKTTTQPLHLLVVGTGEMMDQARDYVKAHSLNVTFAGFLNQSEIARAYSASDCLILASDYDETWGLVVNEAMACGKPAIVSDRCGCYPDLILDGQTGFVFSFSNIDALAEKMKAFAGMGAGAATKIGLQARNNVYSNYSIEKASQGLKRALKNLVLTK